VFNSVPPFSLSPGAALSISERQFDTDAVQQALSWGLISSASVRPADPRKPHPFAVERERARDEAQDGAHDEVETITSASPTPASPPARNPPRLPPDEDVPPDEHEQFRLTGQAQTILRPAAPPQPKDTYVYDPHNERANPKPPMPNAYAYDPHAEQQRREAKGSSSLPIRGAIQPVGMTRSPLQEAQLRTANAERTAAPRRINAKGRSIRPVGGRGGDDGHGGDGVDIEIL
jgi:hypothetical protein